MPNLRTWIEAQLKKGYSKEQIKGFLIRKGYPPKAVAEVDKINIQGNDKKKLGLTVIILVIVVSLVFVYYSFQLREKQDEAGEGIIEETPAMPPEGPIVSKVEITEEASTRQIIQVVGKELLTEEAKPALPESNPK